MPCHRQVSPYNALAGRTFNTASSAAQSRAECSPALRAAAIS
jgi:hypothetical protein